MSLLIHEHLWRCEAANFTNFLGSWFIVFRVRVCKYSLKEPRTDSPETRHRVRKKENPQLTCHLSAWLPQEYGEELFHYAQGSKIGKEVTSMNFGDMVESGLLFICCAASLSLLCKTKTVKEFCHRVILNSLKCW